MIYSIRECILSLSCTVRACAPAAVQSERKPNQITSRAAPFEMYVVNNCVCACCRSVRACVCVCVGWELCTLMVNLCVGMHRRTGPIQVIVHRGAFACGTRILHARLNMLGELCACARGNQYLNINARAWIRIMYNKTNAVFEMLPDKSQLFFVRSYGTKYEIFSCSRLFIPRLCVEHTRHRATHSHHCTCACVSADQIEREHSQTSHTITYESDIKSGLTCLITIFVCGVLSQW